MLSKLVTGNHTGCVWLNSVSPLNSLLLYNALGKHSLKEEVKSSCEFWDCNCQSRETDLMKIVFWKLTVVVLSNNVPRLQLCECLQHRKCCFSNVGSWDPTRTGCNLVNKKRCLLLWQLDMYLTHKTQSKPKGIWTICTWKSWRLCFVNYYSRWRGTTKQMFKTWYKSSPDMWGTFSVWFPFLEEEVAHRV